ncbi:restriction endonuclease subunit S [Acinetobacter pittii]
MATPKLRFKEFDGDWGFRKIRDISDSIVPGRNKPKLFDGDIPWVTTPDIKDKIYVSDTQSNYYISEVEAKNVGSKIVPTNSVIMSCVGDLGLFAINTKPIVINQQLHAFLLDNSKYSSVFVLNAISKNQNFIEKVATKTALPYLNKDNCNSIPLFLCSFEEQTKIASFLSAVDEKISQLNQKHKLLSQYKQGMMQKLFSQQIRFKADDGSEFGTWEEIILSDVAKRVTRKNKEDNQNALTISAQMGLVNQQDYFTRQIASRDLSKYYLLYKGEFAYNKSYSAGYPMGAIKRLKLYEKGVVSTLYICFSLNPEIDSDFFEHYVESGSLVPELEKIAQEGARNHGLLNISLQEFFEVALLKPCLEEQTKIANFLSSIDQKIEVVAQQIEQAKQWKKGLLQQMFV